MSEKREWLCFRKLYLHKQVAGWGGLHSACRTSFADLFCDLYGFRENCTSHNPIPGWCQARTGMRLKEVGSSSEGPRWLEMVRDWENAGGFHGTWLVPALLLTTASSLSSHDLGLLGDTLLWIHRKLTVSTELALLTFPLQHVDMPSFQVSLKTEHLKIKSRRIWGFLTLALSICY